MEKYVPYSKKKKSLKYEINHSLQFLLIFLYFTMNLLVYY